MFWAFEKGIFQSFCKFLNDEVETGAQLGGGRGRGLPRPFLKIEKSVLILEKKVLVVVHSWVECSVQNVALRVSRRKTPKVLPCVAFFLCFWRKVYRSALIPQNLPCPKKFLVARLWNRFLGKLGKTFKTI